MAEPIEPDRDSPPPAPPTASTPGPRAQAFQTLYANALQNTLKTISYESFAACFPGISAGAPETLRAFRGDFVERLERFALEEFNEIMTERNVTLNLNAFEDLIAAARTRRSRSVSTTSPPVQPPHTLPAAAITAAHVQPLHKAQQSQLNARLQNTEAQNVVLGQRVREQRKEIEELMGMLEKVVGDLDGVEGVLREGGTGLSEASREAEGVLGRVK